MFLRIFSLLCVLILLPSCASMIRGYEDTIIIRNPPDSLKISTIDGVSINYSKKTGKIRDYSNRWYEGKHWFENQTYYEFKIPSNQNHVITFESRTKKKNVLFSQKLATGWFFLDILFIVPAIYDGVSGNWYFFDDVDLSDIN